MIPLAAAPEAQPRALRGRSPPGPPREEGQGQTQDDRATAAPEDEAEEETEALVDQLAAGGADSLEEGTTELDVPVAHAHLPSSFGMTLFLVNGQEESRPKDESYVYQPELIATAPDDAPVFTQKMQLRHTDNAGPAAKLEEETMAMLYRHKQEFAVGHGVSVRAQVSDESPGAALSDRRSDSCGNRTRLSAGNRAALPKMRTRKRYLEPLMFGRTGRPSI